MWFATPWVKFCACMLCEWDLWIVNIKMIRLTQIRHQSDFRGSIMNGPMMQSPNLENTNCEGAMQWHHCEVWKHQQGWCILCHHTVVAHNPGCKPQVCAHWLVSQINFSDYSVAANHSNVTKLQFHSGTTWPRVSHQSSVCQSVCLSDCLSVSLSVCLNVCLSFCLS